jgi:hypothetical protein
VKQYLVTKRSSLTGKNNSFYIWFNKQQWEEVQSFLTPELPKGRSIHEILPDHSPYEKEFLLSGTTAAERSV